MSDLAIRLEGVSKKYRIGGEQHTYKTLRDTITDLVVSPFRQAGRLLRGRCTGTSELDQVIWALRDVSFEVKRGEVMGIIGANGAGKSTLLKILSRITEPTEGYAECHGRLGSLLEVGIGFHPELTGRENIYLNGAILGMKKVQIERQLDEIVAFAEVERFVDTPVKHYSTGMSMRLGFAVAAHMEPDILLVDEVLAVGDAGFQKKCLGTMDGLRDSGRTVLLVSHNMAAIENHCSRVIWIDGGNVRSDGSTKEVIMAYQSSLAGTNGAVDLGQARRRTGTGAIRYTRVEVFNSGGGPRDFIHTGGRLTIRLHYHAFQAVSYPHFGVEIHTNLGSLVAGLNTWSSGIDIPTLQVGTGSIDLQIESLTLIPSRYYVSIWASSVGLVYDRVDACASFDVEAADYYHSGRGMDAIFGIVVFPCRWNVSGCRGIETSKTRQDHH